MVNRKIFVIISGHIPSQWAHSINTVKHANGFLKNGYDVEILAPLRWYEKIFLNRINNIYEFYGISDNIKFVFFNDFLGYFQEVPGLRLFYKIVRRMFPFCVEKIITRYVIQNQPYLVYARTYNIPIYLIKNNIPVIIETHAPQVKKEMKPLFKLATHPAFIGISTISKQLKERYFQAGVPYEKIIVQEDAVDIEQFDIIPNNRQNIREKIGLPEDKFIITYCGSLHAGKGIPFILKVAEYFKNYPSVVFYLIGGPESQKKYYKIKATEKGLKNIRFTGFINNSLVPYYLKASNILVLFFDPKEDKPVMDLKTTSPIKLFEYMASRVPIIVTDIPTIRKIVDERCALLVLPNNVEKTARLIKKLITQPKLGEKLAFSSYSRVQNYTYRERCRNLLIFLKDGKNVTK